MKMPLDIISACAIVLCIIVVPVNGRDCNGKTCGECLKEVGCKFGNSGQWVYFLGSCSDFTGRRYDNSKCKKTGWGDVLRPQEPKSTGTDDAPSNTSLYLAAFFGVLITILLLCLIAYIIKRRRNNCGLSQIPASHRIPVRR